MKIKKIIILLVCLLLVGGVSCAPTPADIVNPVSRQSVYSTIAIDWDPFADAGFVYYNITLTDTHNNHYTTINYNTSHTSQLFDFTIVPEGSYFLVVAGCNTTDECNHTEIEIYVDSYLSISEEQQGIHIWVFVLTLSMIAGSMFFYYRFGAIPFGIFSGVIFFMLAGLIHNGIIYDVCDATAMSSVAYCHSFGLDVPNWFTRIVEIMFVLLGFVMLIDPLMMGGEKSRDTERNSENLFKKRR